MINHPDVMWRIAEIDRRTDGMDRLRRHNYPGPLAYPCHDAVTNVTDPRPTALARILHHGPRIRH